MSLDFLRPTEAEISDLALRETEPKLAADFSPITKGPVVAVLLLAGVAMAALPLHLWRALRLAFARSR